MKFFSGKFFFLFRPRILRPNQKICSILSYETRSKSLYPAINTLPTEVKKKMLRTDIGFLNILHYFVVFLEAL
jgi:hypothetical protein